MANAIVGSLKLLLLAAVMGLPVGLMAGVYLAEFGGKTFSFVIRYTTDLLNGVPSIVIGIFAYSLAVLPVKHFSTLAGGFALGMMVIPITVRSTEEFLRAVPGSLREGAMALGASKWRTISSVVLPAASGGIVTGMLLALARVAGETAPLAVSPLLATAFGVRAGASRLPSLPVMIYHVCHLALRRLAPAGMGCRLGPAWRLVLIANLGCRLVLNRRGNFRSV